MTGIFTAAPEGVRMRVRLTPKASAERIDGVAADAEGNAFLKARVTAVPEKGKANQALIRMLAKALGVPKSALEVVAGASERNKTVLIAGAGQDELARFEAWADGFK